MKQPFVKKIIFAAGVLASLFVLTVLFLFLSTLKKPATTPPTDTRVVPKDTTTTLIKKVQPASTLLLPPGQTQTFTVTLDPSMNPRTIQSSLTSSPPSDASEKKEVPITVSYNNTAIIITTVNQIEPVNTYILTLSLRGSTILRESYLSAPPVQTPVPTNNPTLSSFLPYETLNYSLEFNREQNVYIMHFKYDTNSREDLSVQFNKAKENANAFMTSKGIDTTTVVVRYLYK